MVTENNTCQKFHWNPYQEVISKKGSAKKYILFKKKKTIWAVYLDLLSLLLLSPPSPSLSFPSLPLPSHSFPSPFFPYPLLPSPFFPSPFFPSFLLSSFQFFSLSEVQHLQSSKVINSVKTLYSPCIFYVVFKRTHENSCAYLNKLLFNLNTKSEVLKQV